MKKMIIFEPAMCCSTGVCGPAVEPELLRISTVMSNLKSNGVLVERVNLTSNPQMFVDNKAINKMLNTDGIDVLPVTMIDGDVVKIKAYPTDEEFCSYLGVSDKYLKGTVTKITKGCGCKGGNCS